MPLAHEGVERERRDPSAGRLVVDADRGVDRLDVVGRPDVAVRVRRVAGAPVREVEPVEARRRWRCCCRAGRRLAHRALVELHRERLRRHRRARVRVRSGFGGRLARRRVLRSLLLDHCAPQVPDVEHRTAGLLQVLLGRVFEPSRGREVRGVGDAGASASDGAGLALHRPSDRQRVKDALGATLVRAGCERHDKRSAHEREQRDDSRLVAMEELPHVRRPIVVETCGSTRACAALRTCINLPPLRPLSVAPTLVKFREDYGSD